VPTPPIAIARKEGAGDGDEGPPGLWLRFALPKGAYATVLLREFLKGGATLGEAASNASF